MSRRPRSVLKRRTGSFRSWKRSSKTASASSLSRIDSMKSFGFASGSPSSGMVALWEPTMRRRSSIDTIVERMLGRKLEATFPKHEVAIGGTIFEVNHLTGEGGVNDVSMHINAGEIVGISACGRWKNGACKASLWRHEAVRGGDHPAWRRGNPKPPRRRLPPGLPRSRRTTPRGGSGA